MCMPQSRKPFARRQSARRTVRKCRFPSQRKRQPHSPRAVALSTSSTTVANPMILMPSSSSMPTGKLTSRLPTSLEQVSHRNSPEAVGTKRGATKFIRRKKLEVPATYAQMGEIARVSRRDGITAPFPHDVSEVKASNILMQLNAQRPNDIYPAFVSPAARYCTRASSSSLQRRENLLHENPRWEQAHPDGHRHSRALAWLSWWGKGDHHDICGLIGGLHNPIPRKIRCC